MRAVVQMLVCIKGLAWNVGWLDAGKLVRVHLSRLWPLGECGSSFPVYVALLVSA